MSAVRAAFERYLVAGWYGTGPILWALPLVPLYWLAQRLAGLLRGPSQRVGRPVNVVGNVTVARGPGTFPIVGFLAAGGIGRQRLNLDRVRVQGIELSAAWRAHRDFSFNASLLMNDATVQRTSLAPGLVGKQVAQVPRRNASLGAVWNAPGGIMFSPRLRWIGRQFEDDENTLRLGEVVVADLGASRKLTANLELFLTLENLGNARIETGRSADGVVNVGTPRLLLGGLRGRW